MALPDHRATVAAPDVLDDQVIVECACGFSWSEHVTITEGRLESQEEDAWACPLCGEQGEAS